MRLIALLALASACADDPDQVALDAARARWDASGIADYSVVVSYVYSHDPAALLEVRGGEIRSSTNVETGEPLLRSFLGPFRTVEGQFEYIQNSIDRGPIRIDNTYDETLGYPRVTIIEWPADAVDGPIPERMDDLAALAPL